MAAASLGVTVQADGAEARGRQLDDHWECNARIEVLPFFLQYRGPLIRPQYCDLRSQLPIDQSSIYRERICDGIL